MLIQIFYPVTGLFLSVAAASCSTGGGAADAAPCTKLDGRIISRESSESGGRAERSGV